MINKTIDRRTFLKTLGAGVSFAFTGPFGSMGAAKPGGKPNIIMIYADDLDFDELNLYDYHRFPSYTGAVEQGIYNPRGLGKQYYREKRMLMPHIDSLAREGAIFSRFYITSSVCTPSRYSLLTGRYASRSPGLSRLFPPGTRANIQWNTPLLAEETNVAKVLKANGYAAGIVGKWHNGVPAGKVTGLTKTAFDNTIRYLRENLGFDFAERIYFGNKEKLGLPKSLQVHNLEWITEGALKFIDKFHHRPFFLYMALPIPHGQYSSGFLKENPLATPAGLLDKAPNVQPSRQSIAGRLKKAGITRQNAMATWMDDCVGAVLGKLGEKGIADNTVVVFSSDHQSRGKYTCYEGCRVPFIIRWPDRIKPGTRIDAICANIDLAPTFIDMAGGTPPADMTLDGRSFLPLLPGKEKQTKWRDALLLECSNIRAIVTKKWKFIANRPPAEIRTRMEEEARICAKPKKRRRIGWDGRRNLKKGVRFRADVDFPHYFDYDQLYDLEYDVYEQKNLVNNPGYAKKLAEMKQMLKESLKKLPHTFGEFKTK